MARMRERLFAGFGAFLFLASASGLTIFAIMSSNNSADTASQTSQHKTCSDTQKEESLPVPDVYKPDGAVDTLQMTDLTEGSGPEAKSGDCLVMKYYGTLASDGTKFDENFTDTTAFPFTLGQGQVIPGWDTGLIGMKAGGVRRVVIPAAQAYGDQSPTAAIPANSDLVFVVKLLRIQKV